MRAKDLLAAINFDFQHRKIQSLVLQIKEQRFPITRIWIDREKLIFVSDKAAALESKEIVTQLMLHKNLCVYKLEESLVPIYGYKMDCNQIIL